MILLADYDIERAFQTIEEELMKSMIRNMKRHRIEEVSEKKEWEMWQALQLKALEEYKKNNRKRFQSQYSEINKQISSVITGARAQGNMQQEIKILEAIRKGFKPPRGLKSSTQTMGEFFKVNDRKLDALIKATQNDFKKAEYAMLRMSEDQYRKIIFNSQVYANTGAGTYEQAVDMATKDFLNRGINCIEYKNGARHTVASYAAMAIQTASKRAYLTGEGEKRAEWGIHTVIMNKRGNACPKCLPFVGKILIDDVWSGGKQTDGPYMLMSSAIAAGLYHPNCKDSHTTYFEGISTPGASYTREELAKVESDYRREQKQQYAKRQADRFGRLAEHSMDEENQEKYRRKENEWKKSFVDVGVPDEKFTVQNVVKEVSAKSDTHEMNNSIEQKLFGKGIQVNIEEAGKYHEEVCEALNHLDKLTDEYRNTVVSYTVGKTAGVQTEFGSAYMLNGKTSILIDSKAYRINKAIDALGLGEKQPLGITYHEFAHSLSQSKEKMNPEFWKEIRKIKREYEGFRGKSNWFDIKISDYASKDVDEFLAEAFTQAKLSDKPSPFSKQVLDAVDKYFKKQSPDRVVKMPDIKFATKKNSVITAKQKFEDTMTVSKAYNELPIKVKQNISDVTFEVGHDGSACDIQNKLIRVGIGTSKEEIFHETGHLIENYMMSSADVRKYKEFLVDGLSCNDIMVKTYYDNAGNDIDIYLLKGMNFESEYQSRLYVSNPFEALNRDGTINVDILGEAISEVFRKYMNGETISQKAQELIERVIL